MRSPSQPSSRCTVSQPDRVNRIQVVVGAEYESDVSQALELLASAARNHDEVLDDPPPVVTFEEFGADAMTLILHCFLAEVDGRMTVLTELHTAIEKLFREAGIGMAFPQRDVNLLAAEPLRVQVEPTAPGPASAVQGGS